MSSGSPKDVIVERGKNTRITKENAGEYGRRGNEAKREKTTIRLRLEKILTHLAKDNKGKPILDDDGNPMTWGDLIHDSFVRRTATDQKSYEFLVAMLGEKPVEKTETRVTASLTDEDRALMSALLDRKGNDEKGE